MTAVERSNKMRATGLTYFYYVIPDIPYSKFASNRVTIIDSHEAEKVVGSLYKMREGISIVITAKIN